MAEKAPLIYNKQFYWFTEFQPELIESDKLLQTTMDAYKANKKVMDFFAQGME